MDEQTTVSPGLPVDLTREEFVRYHMLLSRTIGPLRTRTVQIVTTAILVLSVASLSVYDWIKNGEADILLLALSGALLVMTVAYWIAMPQRLRRQAGKQYDESVAGGYSYYGLLRVESDRVEKENAEATAVIPLDASAFFIEDATMMIFINGERRAIVLPARCMTTEAAASARQAADRLPPAARRFVGRLQPMAQPVIEPESVETTVLWEQSIRYTPDEYVALAQARTAHQFSQRLPILALISAFSALVFGWNGTSVLPAVLLFLTMFGLLTLFNYVLPRRRIAAMRDSLPTEQLRLWISLTDRGVKLRDGGRTAALPWAAIEHIIDRDTFVEIIRHPQTIRIPKRCIEDFEAFNRLIIDHWKKQ